MKILIVDDESNIRQIARLSLTRFGGMEVLEAASGEEGVAAARKHLPDVILLDVYLPDQDGPQVLAQLREDPVTRDIPVLFLTALTRPSELEGLRAAGPRGILSKPFDIQALPQQVKDALGAP